MYRFDDFLADPESWRLSQDGQEIHLEPLVLQLLIYLIANRERLVTRQELMDTVLVAFRVAEDPRVLLPAMVAEDADLDDVEKYFRALRMAQKDIDLRQELYTHYYRNEFPERFHDRMDTRLFGPGERIVFEPYSREIFDESREWIAERNIFEDGLGDLPYEQAVVVPAVSALAK